MLNKVLGVSALILLFLAAAASSASAAPYASYFFDKNGTYYPSPNPYEPAGVLSVSAANPGESLSGPKDLKLGPDGNLYIADTGQDRIVVLDRDGKIVRTFGNEGDNALFAPSGLFVDDNGDVYVADTGNERIMVYDREGALIDELGKPDSPLLGKDFKYTPVKLAVNEYGYLYVVSQGSGNGIVTLDRNGGFQGFFGANQVENTWLDRLVRKLFSREDRRGAGPVVLPYSYNNIAIDDTGYIYVTTIGLSADQLKKLNGSGRNILPANDYSEWWLKNDRSQTEFTMVAVDRDANSTIVDATNGQMYQYDAEGNLLFAFGGKGDAPGLLSRPAALDIADDGTLFVLEENLAVIQVYERTGFAAKVHEANKLLQEGHYADSLQPWNEVYQLDNYYTLALKGIGRAHLRQDDLKLSMSYFRLAGDYEGYSEAYAKYRKVVFRDRFEAIVLCGAVGLLMIYAFARWRRSRLAAAADAGGGVAANRLPATPAGRFVRLAAMEAQGLLDGLRYAVYTAFHPFRGFADQRYERTPRYRDAALLILLYYALHLLTLYTTGFHFRTWDTRWINWLWEFSYVALPWLVYAHVNYGIATIADGEGRYKDVLVASSFAYVPLLLLGVPMLLLTNYLSLDEAHILELVRTVAWGWTALLLLIKIREIHNYEWPKTFIVYILGFGGMALVYLIGNAAAALTRQVYEFAVQIAKEVMVRGF